MEKPQPIDIHLPCSAHLMRTPEGTVTVGDATCYFTQMPAPELRKLTAWLGQVIAWKEATHES